MMPSRFSRAHSRPTPSSPTRPYPTHSYPAHSYPTQSYPTRQKGVALITMLLIFTLVVILVSGAVARTGHDIRRTSYHLLNSQAYEYALGGEALARQMLHQDWVNDKELGQGDHLNEPWHKDTQFKPDNGLMRIRIRDMESRFNINNLVSSNGEPVPEQVAQFQRLLSRLSIPQERAMAVLDWLDQDTQPRISNSEDVYFQSQESNYRSADGFISDVSELYALEAFEPGELTDLMHEITALPIASTINPNTASETLLSSLHPNFNGAKIAQAREPLPQGFMTNEAFLSNSAIAGIDFNNLNTNVHSQFFMVWVAAQFQEHTVYLRSLLHRDINTGTITTVHRSLQRPDGVFTPPTADKTVSSS